MKVVHNISLEAFLYPTEDQKKVKKAFSLILPEKAKLRKENVKSYYGPPIVKLSCWTDKAPEIRTVLQRIISNLSKEDRKEIVKTIDERMDEDGNLFLRFSKQRAYAGELVLSYKGDAIKTIIKLASYPASLNNMRHNAKILFE